MDKQRVARIWQVLLEIRAMEQGEPAEYEVEVVREDGKEHAV